LESPDETDTEVVVVVVPVRAVGADAQTVGSEVADVNAVTESRDSPQ
jgi:hypothetical protein